jgi:putative transposase
MKRGRPVRRGFTETQVAAVARVDGELPKAALLRCRVRYFTDGAILGSRIFVNEAFQRHQAHFSRSRLIGARPMKGQWGGLCSVRRLRLAVITPPLVA